uniref:C2H2-type domain-containing protein n=1 Tax=Glossina morsitans morsitans TaxID=37546 RepID=A0A1B0G825_GLOMM
MDTSSLQECSFSCSNYNCDSGELPCLLEEDDTQCGHVFYNEITRLLKFYCTFCQETYDNIDYFCQHLSGHIREVQENQGGEEDNGKASPKIEEVHPEVFDEQTNISDCNADVMRIEECEQLDDNEMIIEELDETEAYKADEEEEICDPTNGSAYLDDDDDNSNTCQYESLTNKSTTVQVEKNETASKSFEECFLKEMNVEKLRYDRVCVIQEDKAQQRIKPKKKPTMQELLRFKGKRKKVTTVKVIAVKNRIAELYERIKIEEQKRSQDSLPHNQESFASENTLIEQETNEAIKVLINENSQYGEENVIANQFNNNNLENCKMSGKDVTRKIIGETVITLIPEGSKIPNTLPSQVDNIIDPKILRENLQNSISSDDSGLVSASSETENTVCPACGKRFRSSFSLTIHKRIHYLESDSAVKLAHKCSDCDQLFNKISQLKEHVETIHYPEGFICKICNRKLSSLSLLERHMRKVHLDRPFNCKQCGKNFANRLTYDEHVISHISGKLFKCHICGRKYPTQYFLTEHMRNHKEQVPHTCVVCGKITLRITQHMKIHTPRPKRLLSCSVCGKVFNFSSGLSHHFKIMHKSPRPPQKTKRELATNSTKRRRQLHAPYDEEQSVTSENQIVEENITPINSPDVHKPMANYILQEQNFVNQKEEEAKRVIVELIQNSTYTSFLPANASNILEVTPPIAREETISAVDSIVNGC